MRELPRSLAIALSALLAALLLRWLIDPVLGDTLPFVTLFGAVAAAVWAGGLLAASLVALLGFAATSIYFIEPRGAIDLSTTESQVGLTAYLFSCAVVMAIGESMRAARRREKARGELLRVTLAAIGDAVITTDREGRITYVNAIATSLTGFSESEALGKPIDTVLRVVDETDEDPSESGPYVVRPEAESRPPKRVLIGRDGSSRAIERSVSPVLGADGRRSGDLVVVRDISERLRIERLERQRLATARELAAIVEISDDGIVSKSLDGMIRSWNAGAERIFGHPAAHAVGKHITLVIPPERIQEEEEIIASLRAGRRVDHFETERLRSDGRRISVSLTVSPLRDEAGRVVGASKIVRDVSERKRLEIELRQKAEDLAEVDRRKNEFLATLSHELRNPLAPMRSTLEILKRTDANAESLAQAVGTMDRQLDQLMRLVDDLLDLSRITHNRIELRRSEVALEPLVRQAVEGACTLAESAGHEIQVQAPTEPIHLFADGVRLVQVFGNLLNNACKYTAPGGTITVSLDRRGADVVVTVSDTGSGIPAEKLDTIFEMFTQVEAARGLSQGGLGIGLTLVKRLVEMHGGTVVAKSGGERQGSEFEVRLPALAVAAPAVPLASAPFQKKVDASSRRILVVDDNRDAATSLAMLLEISGFTATVAHDGREALAAIERERPDVVLLDLGLPMLSGHEVCRRVRDEPWGSSIRMIALTGWGQDEDRARSGEAGFDAHLVKPVDIDDLLRILV